MALTGLPELMNRISYRDAALFQGLTESEAERFCSYFFSRPKKPDGLPSLRSQAIGLYDPFCDRRRYSLGILWQSAPYSFCDHGCVYCYGRSCLRRFKGGATVKRGFRRAFDRSLFVMQSLNLSPRHLSMANSSDVLQEKMEKEYRHTLYMLVRLRENREIFSSICILTKNPGILLDDPAYVGSLKVLNVEVQVSMAFWDDDMGKLLEPGAPTVSARRMAVEELAKKGVRVALRIDPLFPRGVEGCKKYQSLDKDIEPLVFWAACKGISYVISSPLKLGYRRNAVSWFNHSVMNAFPRVRRSYRRMPEPLQRRLMVDVKNLCRKYSLPLENCFANILKRNTARSV